MQTIVNRRFGLVQATALNMSNMIGIGPFITIPLLMTALGGPQAMLGWIVGLVIVVCDGMVWSELGAAMPASGGSFGYLREAFGRERYGRLMGFLFVWQFILSGPLEIASGYIGFANYLGYIWTGLTPGQLIAVSAAVGVVNIVLLYRRITSIATITVVLWVGTLVTTIAIIATGVLHFDRRIAFDFPPGAFSFSLGFLFGLGAASRVAVYDYLGYYDVCYIGDEVRDPGRVIPRSIVIGVVLLRRHAPAMARPFRIWLYPVPIVIAFAGWLFIFSTTGVHIILFGLGLLALGVLGFLMWSRRLRQWPFAGAAA
jgi:amino acid transporter